MHKCITGPITTHGKKTVNIHLLKCKRANSGTSMEKHGGNYAGTSQLNRGRKLSHQHPAGSLH